MKRYRFFVVACIFCLSTVLIGCGGGSEEILYEDNFSSKSVEPLNDGSLSVKTLSGTEIISPEKTFASNAEISVKEQAFAGTKSDVLSNANLVLEISGVIKSSNPWVPSVPITNVEKPITVKIQNPFYNSEKVDSINALYLGTRDNESTPWKFIAIDKSNSYSNPQTVSSVRANINASELYFITYRLGIQMAVFAEINGSLVDAVTVDSISTKVFADGSKGEDINKIWTENGIYKENMKIVVTLNGNKTNSFRPTDFNVKLTFISESPEISEAFEKSGYECLEPRQTVGDGKKYVHEVIVKNFDYSNNELSFVLETEGTSDEIFPENFSVSLSNKYDGGNLLPFGYSQNMEIEKSDTPSKKDEPALPSAPKNVTVSAELIALGDSVTISWKAGDSDVTDSYDVCLATDSENFAVVANVKDLFWTLPADDNAFVEGRYTAIIKARNKTGDTADSEKVYFSIANPELLPVKFVEMKQLYKHGETVNVAWEAVVDTFGNQIAYNISLTSDNGYSFDEQIASTSYEFSDLPMASYTLVVSATNGKITSIPQSVMFKVVSDVIDVPQLNEIEDAYSIDDEICISWAPVSDPMGGNIFYKAWVWSGESQHPDEEYYSDTKTEFIITGLGIGTYNVTVLASNGIETSAEADIKTFNVSALATASITVVDSSKCAGGFYTCKPSFEITVSENVYDEATVVQAVKIIDNVTSAELSYPDNLECNWNNGVLTVTTVGNLESNHGYSVSMDSIKDKYNCFNIVAFEKLDFITAPFIGKGFETEPYVVETTLQPTEFVEENKLALIGSISADIGVVYSVMNGIVLNPSVIFSGASVNMGTCSIEDNKLVVGIDDESIWPVASELTLGMAFNGTFKDEICYFKTSDSAINTESGLNITFGDGSALNPYLIYTCAQLDKVREYPDKSFLQIRNLDLNGYVSSNCDSTNGWLPIGCSNTQIFSGVYDGGGKTISNLKISREGLTECGLFGSVDSVDGSIPEIRNLTLANCNINIGGVENSASCLAGAFYNGNMTNCHLLSSVLNTEAICVGGLIGDTWGTHVTSCSVDLEITGDDTCGGLIGYCENCEINECHAKINLNCGVQAGGLIGYFSNSSVQSSSVSGEVYGGMNTGGFVAYMADNASVTDSSAKVNVYSEDDSVSGFVGVLENSSVYNCKAEGNVEGYAYVGGICGSASSPDNSTTLEVIDCGFSGKVSGGEDVGGLIGAMSHTLVKNSTVTAESVSASDYNCGGLIGVVNEVSRVYDCWVKTSEDITANDCVGGIVGNMGGDVEVHRCFGELKNIVTVLGSVGGIVGNNNDGLVCNSYVKGVKVVGANYAGGVVGVNSGSAETNNCYTTCDVDCSGVCGLLIGQNYGYICNCFTTQSDDELPFIGNDDSWVVCVYSLPEGYVDSPSNENWSDWQFSRPWNTTVWDLTSHALEEVNLPELTGNNDPDDNGRLPIPG